MFTLAGKIALVTGAARGIGRGIAEVFAAAGADVAINDIDGGPAAQSLRAQGRRAVVVTVDVARRPQVEPMFEQVWSTLGPIDILVNNAGIETIVPFLDLPTSSGGGWSIRTCAAPGSARRCTADVRWPTVGVDRVLRIGVTGSL